MVRMIRRVMLITIENPDPAHLERMRRCLSETTAHVEGVVKSVVSQALPINNSPCTFVWDTVFADRAAIEVYREHPYHTGVLVDLFTSVKFNATTAFVDDAGA